jgi:hypothetical protein
MASDEATQREQSAQRHRSFGWWSLLFFLALGFGLEAMHGLKLGFYLDTANETRRLMWTLGHAHGALLALIHLGFAGAAAAWADSMFRLRTASSTLVAASVLLPGGFLLGGLTLYDGDPGLGVLLVPVGGLLLLVSVAITALQSGRQS